MDLATLQKQLGDQQGKLPPVDKWDPDFCGDMDLVIKHDGSWFYMGTPIGRKALVKLFASVLKKVDDKYYLVTPVEKLGITVEDVPYVITQWDRQDDLLVFTTQTEEQIIVSAEHPVELKEDSKNQLDLPYINIRRNLWARLHQNVYYQLIAQAEQEGNALYISSGDYRFCLGHL
ncbi:DUF1285 domain-containing protein [Paraglaciecola sp. L1A13]|uniref:DUF1285 domain-containing protein n=1 Tax=Paraglaciecola sp. L1A13 TaxID=2686359 RepID=UPI00131CDD41|nr:DUF1285 domain-containing protein [Paraglaciecola sp. L1A13]